MQRVILGYMISFVLVLILIRAETYGAGYDFMFTGSASAKRILYISYQDVGLAVGLGAVFAFLVAVFKNSRQLRLISFGVFLLLLHLTLLWSLLNIEAVKILNTPVNYKLLYHSDVLESSFVTESIMLRASWSLLGGVALVCLVLFGAAYTLSKALQKIKRPYRVLGAGVALAGLVLYFGMAYRFVERLKTTEYDNYGKVANPVLAFLASVANQQHTNTSFFQSAAAHSHQTVKTKPIRAMASSIAPHHPAVKNVIFFVMESVAAAYVAGYENTYHATPNLARRLSQAVVFKDVYAHNPNSTNSLFSLLASAYPAPTYKNIIREQPDINLPTLSAALKANGYRTAFYGFADKSYMRVDEYLTHQRFDKIVDHKELPCTKTFESEAQGAESGKDEQCMVNDFVRWLDQEENKQPFFAMLWTMQTHWPYFTSGPEKVYDKSNSDFNRYLNALNYTDAVLENLLQELEKRKLAESTLVVVVGDHGQAFGQHGQYGHGSSVYDENIRVPLIMLNPLLFAEEEKHVVGGLVDVPATVMDLLCLQQPTQWQGNSLFDINRENATFFFATWSNYLFGYRKGKYKVVFDVFSDQTFVYDLALDRQEQNNLAPQLPALVQESREQVSNWVYANQNLLKTPDK